MEAPLVFSAEVTLPCTLNTDVLCLELWNSEKFLGKACISLENLQGVGPQEVSFQLLGDATTKVLAGTAHGIPGFLALGTVRVTPTRNTPVVGGAAKLNVSTTTSQTIPITAAGQPLQK
jgi:hypothetical protein